MIEVGTEPITDHVAAEIRCRMRDLGYRQTRAMEDAYRAHAHQHRYHPVRDYLESLQLCEENAIVHLCDHLEDSHGVLNKWLHYWLVGAVGKVMRGTQNRMLVLDGPQGIGKSYLARWLASSLPGFFIEGPIIPSSKDDLIRLTSFWVWEVAELGATTRKADSEALKHFISMREVTVRRPYDRYDTTKPAMASFIGTINNEGGFLQDQTGTRRFLTTSLTRINWDYREAVSPDQVWAVAYRHWQRGEWLRLSAEDARLADEINAQYGTEDPVENLIREHFDVAVDSSHWVSSAEIFQVLRSHGIAGSARAVQMEIASAAKRMGKTKCSQDGKRGYSGLCRRTADLGCQT
jgi:putative DNA primase/helicase